MNALRDFNFFEPFEEKRKKTDLRKMILPGLLILVLGVVAFYQVSLYSKSRTLEEQIAGIESFNNSAKTQNAIIELEELRESRDQKAAEVEELRTLTASLEENSYFNTGVLAAVEDSMPANSFIKSMDIQSDRMQLQGVAFHPLRVAELKYKLTQSTDFYNVFLSSINEEDPYVNFTIGSSIEGGNAR